MAEIEEITPELREKIEPNLKERLGPDLWDKIDEMFSQVVYTYPNGVPLVTLFPTAQVPAMQFSAVTGEFVEITRWSYIITVDVEAQQEENRRREERELLESILKHYHRQDFVQMTDYEKVIADRELIHVDNKEIYKYNCPGQEIYLDNTNYPITYGNQTVSDEWYYYKFNNELYDDELDEFEQDLYRYRVPYEWKRYDIEDW